MENASSRQKVSFAMVGRTLMVLLAVAGCAWGILYAYRPSGSQARVFCEQGQSFFLDFTRMAFVAHEGIHAPGVEPYDICYPALAYVGAKLFRADVVGGAFFSGIGLILFLFACVMLVRARRISVNIWEIILAFAFCSPMLYAIEWGNPIIYAAAGVILWIAWRNDHVPWKRMCAAMALAVAAVLKIAPAVFAFDYLCRREREWKGMVCFLGASVILFFLPWMVWGGGEGLLSWFSRAAANAAYYVHKGAWGAVPLGRTMRVLLHEDVTQVWSGIGCERWASILLGGWGLVWGLRSREEYQRLLGLVAALLLIPGNMHFYTGIYLVPICLLWTAQKSEEIGLKRGWEMLCWFAVFCPLQIPIGVGCLNHPLANLAFLMLLMMAILPQGKAPTYVASDCVLPPKVIH